MALSQEVLDQIAYAEKMGYTKLNQFPPAQTRELMKQAPANPNPTPVGEVINTVIPRPVPSPDSNSNYGEFAAIKPTVQNDTPAPASTSPTPGSSPDSSIPGSSPNSSIPGSSPDSSIPGSSPNSSIPVRIYIPAGAGPFPVISYFHGGGFTLMSIDTHDEICRQLCTQSDCLVMSVDYRLAPEHPFPQGPEDCVTATEWLIRHAAQFKGRGDKAAVAGDSAGGYMALYTAQALKSTDIRLSAEFAAYPVTDHYSAHHPSWEENKTGYVLTAELMKWFWDNYTPDPSTYNAASILRTTDFSYLPPALIMTANYDPLRDEGKAYADKLQKAGVDTIYKNYENTHGFLGLGTMIIHGRAAAANLNPTPSPAKTNINARAASSQSSGWAAIARRPARAAPLKYPATTSSPV